MENRKEDKDADIKLCKECDEKMCTPKTDIQYRAESKLGYQCSLNGCFGESITQMNKIAVWRVQFIGKVRGYHA